MSEPASAYKDQTVGPPWELDEWHMQVTGRKRRTGGQVSVVSLLSREDGSEDPLYWPRKEQALELGRVLVTFLNHYRVVLPDKRHRIVREREDGARAQPVTPVHAGFVRSDFASVESHMLEWEQRDNYLGVEQLGQDFHGGISVNRYRGRMITSGVCSLCEHQHYARRIRGTKAYEPSFCMHRGCCLPEQFKSDSLDRATLPQPYVRTCFDCGQQIRLHDKWRWGDCGKTIMVHKNCEKPTSYEPIVRDDADQYTGQQADVLLQQAPAAPWPDGDGLGSLSEWT